MFLIDGATSCFRIPLNFSIFCSLHLLSNVVHQETIENGRNVGSFHMLQRFQMSSVSLPSSLANLLSGCPEEVTSNNVLRFLLKPSSLEPTESQISVRISFSETHSELVVLSVKKDYRRFIIEIYAKELSTRKKLAQDIQLYIITCIQSIKKIPVNSLTCLPDLSSIDQFYESLVNIYK